MLRKFFTLLALLAFLIVPLLAQNPKENMVPDSTTACQSVITSGAGLTYLQFCVTANGNILLLKSPAGYQHIGGGEGYNLCDNTDQYNYYDYAGLGDNGRWGSSVITQPNGTNSLPLTIQRTTFDGWFTLTQVYTRNASENGITINMTVKNNLAIAKTVYLTRMADVDIDNGSWSDKSYFSFNDQALMAWGTGVLPAGPDPYGLMLYTLTPSVAHSTLFNTYGKTQYNACSIAGWTNALDLIDGMFYLTHHFTLGAHGSKAVKIEYKRF